jgi:NAD(P)-dependent dehydrogenase (short-subunit alcohol dehydrogenase family)
MGTVDRSAEVLGALFDVHGVRALVTGAASGLGFAMAEVLGACGASVTLADIDAELLERASGILAGRGVDVRAVNCDVSNEASVEALFAELEEERGGVDVVFANAGIAGAPGSGMEGGEQLGTVEQSGFDRVLGVNLRGVLFTMKHAAKAMKRQGSGRIVVTASSAGLRPDPMVGYAYTASKAAVLHIVRQAAVELAPHGVLVNAICPGPFKGTRIATGATLDPEPELERSWARMVPLGRMASPEELKGVVMLLASPAGAFITGTALVIDGGVVAV